MHRPDPTRRGFTLGVLALTAAPAFAAASTAVDVRTFGAIGDGNTDDTAALKRAHASGMPLIYPKTSGFFRTSLPLDVKADIVGQGGELRIHGKGTNDQELLRVGKDAPPVTISGMILDGEYDSGTAGEWSHAIALRSARHVRIVGNQIRRPYGDCIYVGIDDETKQPCLDVAIENNQLQSPRRCCVAVISADQVRIVGNRITSVHDYVSAIDLEPNRNGLDRVHDVTVDDNQFDVPGVFLTVTVGVNSPTANVQVTGNRGRSRTFLFVSENGHLVGGVVRDNEFTTNSSPKGSFLLLDSVDDLRVENNRDQTVCGRGGYFSVRTKALPGLTLKNNRFCNKS